MKDHNSNFWNNADLNKQYLLNRYYEKMLFDRSKSGFDSIHTRDRNTDLERSIIGILGLTLALIAFSGVLLYRSVKPTPVNSEIDRFQVSSTLEIKQISRHTFS